MPGIIDQPHTITGEDSKGSQPASQPAAIEFRNILMATDFSKCSDRALRYAIGIAHRYGATLHLFHWVDPVAYKFVGTDSIEAARDRAWREVQQLDTDLVVKGLLRNIQDKVLVEYGELSEILPRVVTARAVDLIVIGTHGRTGWKKLILGSVAERIFRQASCPVLTVGPNVTRSRVKDDGPHDILFPTDFSPQSEAAGDYAFSLAKKYGSHLTLLHVLERASEKILDERDRLLLAKTSLRELAKVHEAAMDKTDCLVKSGTPADSILKTATQKKADLIVLGVRARQGLSDHWRWPNAYRIVCESSCPVLSVRISEPGLTQGGRIGQDEKGQVKAMPPTNAQPGKIDCGQES